MKKYSIVFLALIIVFGFLIAVEPAFAGSSLPCQTYNNTKPGGNRVWVGVDAVEVRPNLRKNGAQLWFHEDGRWDAQGGKFSIFFPNDAAMKAYCANPSPSPTELKQITAKENLCPSSVGNGHRWWAFTQ